jgi:F0F1-type ATP synthase delta subunit
MIIFSLILLQLVIFAVLILVFRKVMTQNVASATRHIEELNDDYVRKEQEVNSRLEQATLEAGEIVNKAREEAEKLKLEVIESAKKESDGLVKAARTHGEEIVQQADKSRQQLLAELEDRIAKEAAKKACELIESALPEQFMKDAHELWVKDLIENGFSGLERLHLPEDLKEIRVVSALALSEEQRKGLNKKLKNALGREISLKEEVDRKVVAGIIIHIGSLVLDGSLKNKIQEKAR